MPELKVHDGAVHYSTGGHVCNVIMPAELEALLEKGVEVYGGDENDLATCPTRGEKDKMTGLLIGYKPIENQEPVSKSEVLKMLKSCDTFIDVPDNFDSVKKDLSDLLKRIEKNGVRND